MRNIIPLFIVGTLVLAAIGAVAVPKAEETLVTIENVQLSSPVFEQADSYLKVTMNEATSLLLDTGKPVVPVVSKVYSFPLGTTLHEVSVSACNKIIKQGKSYRGLNPWQQDDFKLLGFLSHGAHAINGFRNRHLRESLYPESRELSKDEQRKYSGRVIRRIKLLRVHGLIRKVRNENRYVLTSKGHKFATALKVAGDIDIKGLMEMAA